MDRIKIKKPDSTSKTEKTVPVGLSLKVTGIVFWGLVLIGLILVVAAIDWLEDDIVRHHDGIENETYFLTNEFLKSTPGMSTKDTQRGLKKIIESTAAAGLLLNSRSRGKISAGETSDKLEKRKVFMTLLASPETNRAPETATLYIYMTPVEEIINNEKKKLMILMGLLFLSFGLVLQWILRSLLSDPMQQMVATAQAFSKGEQTRFNTNRKDEFGYLARFINQALDKTAEHQKELSYQASHDVLTGLFNRAEFDRRLHQLLDNAKTEGIKSTMYYMDLDQFKIINDTCGHIAGDELLRQISQTLKAQLRESDFIARLGGDEFGVLLPGCTEDDAIQLANKLRQAVSQYHFSWEGRVFQVGVSIGLVPISSDTTSVNDVLSSADVACYAAKEKGRNQIHIYEADDQELQRKRGEMLWVTQIREALAQNKFRLFQQVIIPVSNDPSIKRRYEILLRVPDDNGNLVSPLRFLGAAELYGLMTEIDTWVLRQTFEWMVNNQNATMGFEHLAINLSGQSLSDKRFLDTVISLIDETGIDTTKICFEITETSAIANLERASKFIQLLKGMGCHIALDDFGSGMSSFAYLKNLPIDFLKIDGSYVRDIVNDPIDRALVEAVNQIGHAMGIKTIAEYAEDQATLGALSVIGVDFAQGYGIGKPEPLEKLVLTQPAQIRPSKG